MCGIVGYTGSRPCQEILLAGLEKLEYRGYDSAGLSLIEDGDRASRCAPWATSPSCASGSTAAAAAP